MTNAEFKSWIQHHREVCPRHDWPTGPTPYLPWKSRLDKLRCDLPTALEASNRVAESPPEYFDKHLGAVCDAITAIYRERDAHRGSSENLVERAERGDELNPGEVIEVARLSRECRSCAGNGVAVRHSRTNPSKTLSVHCRCTFGTWIRERCRKTAPDVFRRTPSLTESPEWDDPRNGGPGETVELVTVGYDDDAAF
jgi:hypothetical protein